MFSFSLRGARVPFELSTTNGMGGDKIPMPIANQTRKRKLGTLAKTEIFGGGWKRHTLSRTRKIRCLLWLRFFTSVLNGFFNLNGKRHSRVCSLFFAQLSVCDVSAERNGAQRERSNREKCDLEFGTREHSGHSRKEKLNFRPETVSFGFVFQLHI